MKSKITKIQILMKGMALLLAVMFILTPLAYAADATQDPGDEATGGVVDGTTDGPDSTQDSSEGTESGKTDSGNTGSEDTGSEGTESGEENSDEGSILDKFWNGAAGEELEKIRKKLESGETTIKISNEIQLRAIAEIVNNGENNFENINVILTNNIDINGEVEWTPIGTIDNPFEGRFLGGEIDETGNDVKTPEQGMVISNLEYLKAGNTYKELTNIGLFGVLGTSAEVRNIITENFNINIIYATTDVIASTGNTAGVENTYYHNAGNIAGINNGRIINCVNRSDIKGSSCVGSIAGVNNGKIMNCTNTGVVIGYDCVGGIAGLTTGSIYACKNAGDVKGAEQDVGGIAGCCAFGKPINGEEKSIKLSYNEGNVEGNILSGELCVGSIVGGMYKNEGDFHGLISKCMYNAKTTYKLPTGKGQKMIYGILGNMDDDRRTKVRECIVFDKEFGNTTNVVGEIDNDKLFVDEKWGFVYNAPIDYFRYGDDNWFRDFIGADAGSINDINEGGKSVFIPEGYEISKANSYKNGDGAGMLIFNPEVVTVGSMIPVDYVKDSEEIEEPEEPEKVEGEIRQELSEIFPKAENGTDTNVIYTVKKGDEEVKDTKYFKAGDIITVIAKFNKELRKDDKKLDAETAPVLKLGDTDKVLVVKDVKSDKTSTEAFTTIQYEYVVEGATEEKAGDNFEVKTLKLSGCEGIVAEGLKAEDKSTGTNKEVTTEISTLIIDTIAATLDVVVYVENNLETARYKAGKEILFKVKISEAVRAYESITPDIKVSFSESGVGKYNYNLATKEAGFAKFRNDLTTINADGTTTWYYSYQIQEGDEGYLEYDCFAGKVLDLAGNESSMSQELPDADVSGNEWEAEDLGIEVEIYKKGEKVTEKTSFTKDDELKVAIKFDNVLYDSIGTVNGANQNGKLGNEAAPSLYLNGKESLKEKSKLVEDTEDGKTKITYTYDVKEIIQEKDKTLLIHKLVLKNGNNENVSVKVGQSANGVTPYAVKYYAEYKEADAENYKFIAKNAVKEIILDFNFIIDADKDNQQEGGTEGSAVGIYADTTAPSVQITTNTTEPTSADEITYTFKFSEKVREFEESDITVNGGTIVEGSFSAVEGKEGYEYQIRVKTSSLAGKEGYVQVVVEKGACVDLVAKEVVRQEKIILVDRVNPVLQDKKIRRETTEDKDNIVVDFIFSEPVTNPNIVAELTIGDKKVELVKDENCTINVDAENHNKVILTYPIKSTDGGKVEFSCTIDAKDIAGNNSGEIDVSINSDIELKRAIVEDLDENGLGYVYYTFAKKVGETIVDITDLSKPTYFKEGDTVIVKKHFKALDTIDIKTTEYSYTLIDDIRDSYGKIIKKDIISSLQTDGKPVQMKAVSLSGNSANFETEVSDVLKNIEDANIFFDVLSPTARLSVYVEEPNENNIYASGREFIITATTNEAIENNNVVPDVKVSFTNSGVGKYNKGIAKHIDTIVNEDGTTTWKYKYILQANDDGKSVVEFVEGTTITDLAGNSGTLNSYVNESTLEENWKEEYPKVTYLIKKNDKEVTEAEYFTKGDKLTVEVNFDKVLYTTAGKENGQDITTVLQEKDALKLCLNGNEELAGDVLNIKHIPAEDEKSGITTIVYEFDITTLIEENDIAPIIKVEYFELMN